MVFARFSVSRGLGRCARTPGAGATGSHWVGLWIAWLTCATAAGGVASTPRPSASSAEARAPAPVPPGGETDPSDRFDPVRDAAAFLDPADSPWDALVTEAIRAALLHDVATLEALPERAARLERESRALRRRADTPSGRASGSETLHPAAPSFSAPARIPRLQDRLRLMAVLTASPPLPPPRAARQALAGTRPDRETRAVVAILEDIEPRGRLAAARKHARYLAVTGPFNALLRTSLQVLQGELFAVVELASDTVRSVVRYPYPSPGEREVLRARRDVLASPVLSDATSPGMREKAEKGLDRRRRLGWLEATRNGDRAAERGRLEEALWWHGRAKRFHPEARSTDKRLIEISRRRNREAGWRRESLAALDGENLMYSSDEKMLYAAFLPVCIGDPTGAEAARLREEFLARHPRSIAADEMRLSEIAAFRLDGRPDAGRALAEHLIRNANAESTRARAALLARDPRFSAPAAYEEAKARRRAEFRNYLVFGDRPARDHDRALAPEEARRRHGAWIRALSPFFLTDILGRSLAYPFVRPLDRHPVIAAVERWTPPPPDDSGAAERERARAEALDKDRRYDEAERAFLALDPPDLARAHRARERAARALLRRIRSLENEALKTEELERLLGAYPETKTAPKARKLHEETRPRASLLVDIPKSELRRHPALTAPEALDIPPEWLDGDKTNAELDPSGVEIHLDGSARYRDLRTREQTVRPLSDAQLRRTLSTLQFLRRPGELARGREARKRYYLIPLQVEGSAFPGFEIAPGLAPPKETEAPALYR